MSEKLEEATCKCGHEGKSKHPEHYQCGYCYYTGFARGNVEQADKLEQRAQKLRVEAAKHRRTAEAFKAKHSDVGSAQTTVKPRSGKPFYER